MPAIDRNYTMIALVWLVAGTLFGFWMGASNALQYRTVHVAMLLPGFVTLAIYGFTYRLWPELKESGLARAQFWIASLGQLFLLIASWHFVATGAIWLAAPASAVVIVEAIMLTYMFWSGTRQA
jgi:hypothetical protein